jgi:hypothetical protein
MLVGCIVLFAKGHKMKTRRAILGLLFTLATLLVLSSLFIWSLSNFGFGSPGGISKQTLETIPIYFRSWYQGFPNLAILLSYILYVIVAFISIKEKQNGLKFLRIVSAVFLVLIILFSF